MWWPFKRKANRAANRTVPPYAYEVRAVGGSDAAERQSSGDDRVSWPNPMRAGGVLVSRTEVLTKQETHADKYIALATGAAADAIALQVGPADKGKAEVRLSWPLRTHDGVLVTPKELLIHYGHGKVVEEADLRAKHGQVALLAPPPMTFDDALAAQGIKVEEFRAEWEAMARNPLETERPRIIDGERLLRQQTDNAKWFLAKFLSAMGELTPELLGLPIPREIRAILEELVEVRSKAAPAMAALGFDMLSAAKVHPVEWAPPPDPDLDEAEADLVSIIHSKPPEIRITDIMIEAGAEEVRAHDLGCYSASEIAEITFKAMLDSAFYSWVAKDRG